MNACRSTFRVIMPIVLITMVALPALAQIAPGAKASINSIEVRDAGTPYRVVTLADVPQISAADKGTGGPFSSLAPYTGVSPMTLALRKQTAAANALGLSAPGAVLAPPKGPTGGINTPGINRGWDGIDENCASVKPADMGIAVSQFFVMQAVNTCIAVYNKTGVLQAGFPKTINTWFGLPPNNFGVGQFTADPRLIFDWANRRFIFTAMWIDFPNSRGLILIGASANDDPRGVWRLYMVQAASAGSCPDFPLVGQNFYPDSGLGAVSVGFNLFPCTSQGFTGGLANSVLWFLPKSQLYTGAALSFNSIGGFTYGGTLLDTVQPVNVASRSDKPRAAFAVNSFNINFGGGQCSAAPCNGIVLWAFSNVLPRAGSPGIVWSALVVPTPSNYSIPPDARQAGGSALIATNDVRISGTPPYLGGDIWATVNTALNQGTGILAWRIHPTLNDGDNDLCTGGFTNYCAKLTAATIEEEIPLSYGSSAYAWFGTIMPDPERNITMVYNYSNTATFGSVVYTSRRVTGAQGAWHDGGIYLMQGQAYYNQYRWGDYTGAALDQLDPATGSGSTTPGLWFSGMYTKSNGIWGTYIGRNGYVYSNQP